ncbi:hypothetical protein MP228_007507 [Amoeboaphelidium protococcarum]|nr:hypothetical protein MP228_007507 [Amoeboaphelidium protococcarum]
MYLHFTPHYIFGFKVANGCRDMMFDSEEIEMLGLYSYADEVVRGYACDFLYGIDLESIGEPAPAKVIKEVEHAQSVLSKKYGVELKTGYFVGLSGDFEEYEMELYEPADEE